MSFTFLPNIPAASDLISSSQAQIQENFQYLGDTSGNVSTGGYRLPNGLIINWRNQGPAGWSASGIEFLSPNQTFLIPYTSSIFAIVLTPRVNDATSKRFVVDGITPPTLTEFIIRASTLSFSTIYWIAIGV